MEEGVRLSFVVDVVPAAIVTITDSVVWLAMSVAPLMSVFAFCRISAVFEIFSIRACAIALAVGTFRAILIKDSTSYHAIHVTIEFLVSVVLLVALTVINDALVSQVVASIIFIQVVLDITTDSVACIKALIISLNFHFSSCFTVVVSIFVGVNVVAPTCISTFMLIFAVRGLIFAVRRLIISVIIMVDNGIDHKPSVNLFSVMVDDVDSHFDFLNFSDCVVWSC